MKRFCRFVIVLSLFFTASIFSQDIHPNLVLTKNDVKLIKENLGKVPLFDKVFNKAKKEIDKALKEPIVVPVPKDPGGGYTHEKHKKNYNEMYLAGIMYSVTGEVKYAEFIKNMLDKYAEMYPSLPMHPYAKPGEAGKLFWQSLNETVWLFYTIQAYDCIYDWLSPAERENFEKNIFRPMCNIFIYKDTDQFDLIHNHGTWMDAAVGMTGFVLHDSTLINKALYGSQENGKAGYIIQLRKLFSPDGYYTEGPYYARYALMPFFLFAEAINNNKPDLKIFKFRDRILKKAFYSAMQLTYTTGAFIPVNDALKEKTFRSVEVVFALDITYSQYGADKNLLSIVKAQKEVMLNGAGLMVAKDFDAAKDIEPFDWKSVEYSDGPDGKEGGISILRSGPPADEECMVFKYTSFGHSHGHYDKLSMLFYDQDREILQDYGSARFLNVVQKDGGRYLLENKTYAKQTVAHNTIVVDEKSDYNGKFSVAEKNHSDAFYFSDSNPDFQVTSAVDSTAYPGVIMHRTILMVKDPSNSKSKPSLIDIFRVSSNAEHRYDLPFYYKGHLINTSFNYKSFDKDLKPLGKKNGYQYLWKTAEGSSDSTAAITWLNGDRYYTISTTAKSHMDVDLTMIGANDPNYNLRNDPGIMFRIKGKDDVFASVIEPHGEFNATSEYSVKSFSQVQSLKIVASNDEGTVVRINLVNGNRWLIMVANKTASENAKHSITAEGQMFEWTGPVSYSKN